MAWKWCARWATLVECSPTPVSECLRTHRKLHFQKSGPYRLPRAAYIRANQSKSWRYKVNYFTCRLAIDYLSIPAWPHGPVLSSRSPRDVLYCNVGLWMSKTVWFCNALHWKMSLENAQNQIQNLLPSKLMRWMNSRGQMLSGSMPGFSHTIL